LGRTLLLDGSGAVSDAYRYTAFGEELTATGSSENPHRFGGQFGYYRDTPDRLYVRSRYLQPATGWLSVDPVPREPRYRYAYNNPLGQVDPSGMLPVRPLTRLVPGMVLPGGAASSLVKSAAPWFVPGPWQLVGPLAQRTEPLFRELKQRFESLTPSILPAPIQRLIPRNPTDALLWPGEFKLGYLMGWGAEILATLDIAGLVRDLAEMAETVKQMVREGGISLSELFQQFIGDPLLAVWKEISTGTDAIGGREVGLILGSVHAGVVLGILVDILLMALGAKIGAVLGLGVGAAPGGVAGLAAGITLNTARGRSGHPAAVASSRLVGSPHPRLGAHGLATEQLLWPGEVPMAGRLRWFLGRREGSTRSHQAVESKIAPLAWAR
jgi:RHS repeat-associated protein